MSNLSCGEDGAETVNLSFRSLSQLPDKLWDAHQLVKLVLAGTLNSFITNFLYSKLIYLRNFATVKRFSF